MHLRTFDVVLVRISDLTILETTAVSPEGHGTLHDVSLWSVAPVRASAQFAHSLGDSKFGVHLGCRLHGLNRAAVARAKRDHPEAIDRWPMMEMLARSLDAYEAV